MSDWEELSSERLEISKSAGKITKLAWTPDGQILTVATSNGYFLGFLTIIPSLYSSCEAHAALLSSLSEISIVDTLKNNQIVNKISLDIEPGFLTLGPKHCAVGINNNIWYYRWRDNMNAMSVGLAPLVCKRDYFGTIKMVAMNELWTAVLSEGRCTLHTIEGELQGTNVEDRRFPQNETDKPIQSIALTESFLIMIDTAGRLRYYFIEENTVISEFRPENPIVKVFPNRSGTKCICIDNTGCGYLYNPVDDSVSLLPNFSGNTTNVLWDLDDQHIFATVDGVKMQTYMFVPCSLDGPSIVHLPEYLKLEDVDKSLAGVVTEIDRDISPIILKNGHVSSHSKTEGIRGQYLSTHSYITSWRSFHDTEEGHLRYFLQNLAINRFEACFQAA
jgi:WD repeat-containing protein 19